MNVGNSALVSIIVPIFNAEKTLQRCLLSLQMQTYDNIEVLMVDDGSTDDSLLICQDFESGDRRFRLIRTPGAHSVAAARNVGLGHYTGQYLMFADADDLVSNNYVERLLEILIYSRCNIATCIAYDTDDSSILDYKCPIQGSPRIIDIKDYDFSKKWSHRVVWGAIYKREIIGDMRFDEKYKSSTDTLFVAELLQKQKQIVHIDEPLYAYVYYPDSVCHRAYDWNRFSDVQIWEEIAYRVFKDGPELPKISAEITVLNRCLIGMREMVAQGNEDRELMDELIQRFRKNRRKILGYDLKMKTKLKYLLIAIIPSIYLRYRQIKRKAPEVENDM